jgi:undecaprenyl diphosphate synthase
MQTLDPKKLPGHLAIIMDGNGRWAQERMLKRIVGHRKGVETVRTIVEESSLLGIKYLTLFAFSSENWLRPKTEVRALMALLKAYLAKETSRMMTNNIRFAVIGDRSDLPEDVNRAVTEAIAKTAHNTGMVLTMALSYGSRQEIIQAVSQLVDSVLSGTVSRENISEDLISSYLYTSEIPDPDFLIRTSGEMRISNFLLWQIAYTELYFTEVNWPDFSKEEFHSALANYQARERRYGLISDQVRKRR